MTVADIALNASSIYSGIASVAGITEVVGSLALLAAWNIALYARSSGWYIESDFTGGTLVGGTCAR